MGWKEKVINRIDESIKTLSDKTSSKPHKGVVQQGNPINNLNGIQNQFVVTLQ